MAEISYRRRFPPVVIKLLVPPKMDHAFETALFASYGNLTSPRIPRTASLGYRRKGAEPWLLTVASRSGSTADVDVADLAFARAWPWLDRGEVQRHADFEGDVGQAARALGGH